MNTRDWTDSAVCAQTDPELFFPTSGKNADAIPMLNLCDTCPVIKRCAREAAKFEKNQPATTVFGVWGGMAQTYRRALRSTFYLREQIKVLEWEIENGTLYGSDSRYGSKLSPAQVKKREEKKEKLVGELPKVDRKARKAAASYLKFLQKHDYAHIEEALAR